MRQEGGAALHRANQYIEDMAYKDPAGFAANVLPLAAVGRAAALGRIGKLADGAEAGARAEAAVGNTAKAARLSQQAARYREAIHLARGGKAGAAVRDAQAQATEKLSASTKATLAKAKAAAAKRKERKLNERRMAAPGKLKERWRNQSGGSGGSHGQPALAGVSGGEGGGTKAIGKPGTMQMVGQGKLTGKPTRINPGEQQDNIQALTREKESAQTLVDNGYNVEQNPPPPGNGKNPDYRIDAGNGPEYYDNYAPSTSNVRNIGATIQKKVADRQADRIVANLDDTSVTPEQLRAQLVKWNGPECPDLKEVLAIKGGQVVRIYP